MQSHLTHHIAHNSHNLYINLDLVQKRRMKDMKDLKRERDTTYTHSIPHSHQPYYKKEALFLSFSSCIFPFKLTIPI